MSDESNDTFRVKGTLLGQPIDVIVGDADSGYFDEAEAESPVRDLTGEAAASPEVPEVPADTPNTGTADPAPEATPQSNEAPNPAGNAEQL